MRGKALSVSTNIKSLILESSLSLPPTLQTKLQKRKIGRDSFHLASIVCITREPLSAKHIKAPSSKLLYIS